MKKDWQTESVELLLMLLALVILLRVSSWLFDNGAFTSLQPTRQPLGPLLLAYTTHSSVTPGHHPAMEEVAAAARSRGVEEERVQLGEGQMKIMRGELAGVYHAEPSVGMKCPAEIGVVLDVGANRVTEDTRAAWQARLRSAGLSDVVVRIIHVPDALCVSVKSGGNAAKVIGQWRSYRKLLRRWAKAHGRGIPNVIVETISETRDRVLVALPIDCTKSLYSS